MPGVLYGNYVLNASQELRTSFRHFGLSVSTRNAILYPNSNALFLINRENSKNEIRKFMFFAAQFCVLHPFY